MRWENVSLDRKIWHVPYTDNKSGESYEAILSPAALAVFEQRRKGAVVASAINEKAEELFPRKWNEEFIDAPIIEKQNQPSTTSEGMAEILRYADGQFRVLYALLGGCGPLRAGEALGLEIGKHISEDCRTLYVRQKAKRGKIQPNLKTKHGERDTDLCTPLAAMLRDFIGSRTSGLLFCTSTGKQLLQSNTLQDSLHPILKKIEHEKGGFNIFRRFRITQLETAGVPEGPTTLLVGTRTNACLRTLQETTQTA
jgi:hypothetical protein